MARAIATRNGEPAWVNAPEPMKAGYPMKDWLARHGDAVPARATTASRLSPFHVWTK